MATNKATRNATRNEADPYVLTMYRASHLTPGTAIAAPLYSAPRPSFAVMVAYVDAFTAGAASWVIYHLIERPIKRTARRIAYSGHWQY